MTTRIELIEEKLTNFKNLIDANCHEKESEYYHKMMAADASYMITFASANISAYKVLGMENVVDSFMNYLALDLADGELRNKITRYFDFFVEILEL